MTTAMLIVGRSMPRCLLLGGVLALLPSTGAHAQEEIELNMRRLSDRVLVTWGCDYFQGTNMAVLTTEQGLVVIDTGLSTTTVGRQRRLVEEELRRDDFRYLINTHMDNDHTFANKVFPEATVVGPRHSVEVLRGGIERIPELAERLRSRRESYREWAAATSPDSVEGLMAREGVAAYTVSIADLEEGVEPRYPTALFDDHHVLDLGDLRIELFDFRGFHSDGDILILVPEERTLFTGDVFRGGLLPTLGTETLEEFSLLMDHWRSILEISPDLEHVVTGHSDVSLTVDQFREMYAYLARLWSDVQEARSAGTGVVRFFMEHDFAERYPEVADLHWVMGDLNLHQHNVYVLWGLVDG